MKILILSEDKNLDKSINDLIESIPGQHQIIFTNSAEDPMELIANKPDLVICAENFKMPIIQLFDSIPVEERPIFVIDGKIEDIIDKECSSSSFSGVVAVQKFGDNAFKFEKAYHDSSLNVGSYFNIASVTKMMTAIATSKFMQEHVQFQLDKPIYQSLIEMGNVDEAYLRIFQTIPNVTPRQLLSHTSGLQDNLGKIFEKDLGPEILDFKTVKDYTEHFQDFHEPLKLYHVGEHRYCNFGYQLLGLMIEAVTGNYYNYMQSNIFEKANMESTLPERQPGSTFVLPHFAPLSLPNLSELDGPQREFLKKVIDLSPIHERIQTIYNEFQAELSSFSEKKEYEAFKSNFKSKLVEVFDSLKSLGYFELIEANIRVGLSFEPGTPEYDFYARTYDYLEFQPFWAMLNSLSLATPDGRNMYSTSEDLMRFSQFLTEADLEFLTTETAPFDDNIHRRYGFGCAINADASSPNFTIAHSGGAPGMSSELRIYPNQNLVLTTLSNATPDSRHIANLLEHKLIYRKQESLFYLDSRLDPNSSELILQAIHKQKFREVKEAFSRRQLSTEELELQTKKNSP